MQEASHSRRALYEKLGLVQWSKILLYSESKYGLCEIIFGQIYFNIEGLWTNYYGRIILVKHVSGLHTLEKLAITKINDSILCVLVTIKHLSSVIYYSSFS